MLTKKLLTMAMGVFALFGYAADTQWENLEWVYMRGSQNREMYPVCMRILGVETINGEEYHKCLVYKEGEFNSEMLPDAYLREENGRVYMINGPKAVEDRAYEKSDYYGFTDREILIYDFNIGENESYRIGGEDDYTFEFTSDDDPMFPMSYWTDKGLINVSSVGEYDTLTHEALTSQELTADNVLPNTFKVVEKIGVLDQGFLPFPGTKSPYTGWHPETQLQSVKDLDGNLVYFNAQVGVESVSADALCVSGGRGEILVGGDYPDLAVYDTTGRRYAGTRVPAGLYIVAAGGRTAKVLVK